MKVIEKKISCDKTLQLIRKSLTAGYIDPDSRERVRTDRGTPQGSVLSPLLSNIVLNELDIKMKDIIERFEKGKKRSRNKEYDKITSRIQYLQKSSPGSPEIKDLAKRRRLVPSLDNFDPNFKRMMYLRYADDFVVLITGSLDEAKHTKHLIADILSKKCGLELSKDKTLITATKEGFEFLGAWCVKVTSLNAGLLKNKLRNPSKYRMRMRVEIPITKLVKRLVTNKFVVFDKYNMPKATARKDLINFSHQEILAFYNNRIRGLTTFYSFASNLTSLRKVIMFLHLSCALTLALKYKLRTKKAVFNKFGRTLLDPETDTKLDLPKDLKVKHLFRGVETVDPESNLKRS